MSSGGSPSTLAAASREDARAMRDPRRTAWRAAVAAALWLAAAVDGAPAPARADDTDEAPRAWTRVDAGAAPQNLVVERRDTRQSLPVVARRLLQDSRELYLRSADMATLLRATRGWQDSLRRLELGVDGRNFTVTGGSRVVLVGATEALLPVPVLDHDGELWLPLTTLLQVIGPAAHLDVAWEPAVGRLVLGSADDNVDGLVIEALGDGTAVHVRCREALSWSVDRPVRDRIELTLRDARADVAGWGRAAPSGLVERVEARQDADRLLVTVRLDDAAGEHRSYAVDGGRDVVVHVAPAFRAGGDSVALAAPDAPVGPAPEPAPTRPLRAVVVDPGHGGGDTGAVGAQGTLEKDVNLAVARELKRYLEQESELRVLLTRERDESLEIDARAEFANAAGGDLFISLHCNSWFDDQANGFETWFLSPAGSDWARSVEAVENGTAAGGREPGDVEFIVWELVQNRYISESSRFAEFLQARASRALGMPDRGVRQAGFRVLVGAFMPAVLVELGFVSPEQEVLLLGDRAYQRLLARAIGDAVLAYASAGAGIGSGVGR
ncbi:N-acetylmuramoyl-L-alanine amidase [bacterium]|nr:N-acetylmuramoyl-L-alanine amidase [bacterium]